LDCGEGTGAVGVYVDTDKEEQQDYISHVSYAHLETTSQASWAQEEWDAHDSAEGSAGNRVFACIQIVQRSAQKAGLFDDIGVHVLFKDIDSDGDEEMQTLKHTVFRSGRALSENAVRTGMVDRMRVVFAVQIPSMSFRADFEQKVAVGVCEGTTTDTMRLIIFDLAVTRTFLLFLKGANICGSPLVHAHLDRVLRVLYVVTSDTTFFVVLDSTVKHSLQMDKSKESSVVDLTSVPHILASAKSPVKTVLQIAPASQIAYIFFQPPPLPQTVATAPAQHMYLLVEHEDRRVVFAYLYIKYTGFDSATVDALVANRQVFVEEVYEPGFLTDKKLKSTQPVHRPDTTNTAPNMLEVFDTADVLAELYLQIRRRHTRGVDTSNSSSSGPVEPVAFSVVSDLKTRGMGASTPAGHTSLQTDVILVMLYQQQNEHETTHIVCLVRLGTRADTTLFMRRVELMTVTPVHAGVQTRHFMYTVIPVAGNTPYPNVVYAKGAVVHITQDGLRQITAVYAFSCAQCDSDTRWYNKATDECECLAGSVPVCLPCETNCDPSAFVINPDSAACVIAAVPALSRPVSAPSLPRYNMHCMSCTAHFYCTDGTVAGVRQCPPNRPYVLARGASVEKQCVCGPGYADRADMLYDVQIMPLTQSRQIDTRPVQLAAADTLLLLETNSSLIPGLCSQCHPNTLCAPHYTSKHYVIPCPANTRLSAQYFPTGHNGNPYQTVLQKCTCIPGYYSLRASTEVPLPPPSIFWREN